ncbi:MAG: bacteriohemerythrin [Myxococcales bacterium]
MFPQWHQELATGVAEVDEQHQRLIAEIAALVARVKAQDFSSLSETLRFLAGYAQEHFATEEALMRRAGYPGLAEHAEAHRAFVREFVELKSELEAEGPLPTLVLKMGNWLFDWLRSHVRNLDLAMGDWLRVHS